MPAKRKIAEDAAEAAPARASKRQSTAAAKTAAVPKPAPVKKASPPKNAPAKKSTTAGVKKTTATTTKASTSKKSTPAATKTAAKTTLKKVTATKPATKTAPKKATVTAIKKVKKATKDQAAADEAAADVAAASDASSPAPAAPKVVKEKVAPIPKPHKFGPTINQISEEKLHIWVFGEGSQGELGLGHMIEGNREPIDVARPRLNPILEELGIVRIAVGGMHSAAISHDNKIYTWGVNDQGALGRDTTDNRPEEEKDDEDDSGLNPEEATPKAVESIYFPKGTVFTDLCCSDSATFVVTQDGSVYGWGTFRAAEGILGFAEGIKIQYRPILIKELKKIIDITCGANHIMARDEKKNVFAWGCGQQNQLGRRVVERTRMGGLVPREFGLKRGAITFINSGAYHSFAIDNKGQVWAWGLNNYGQTGIEDSVGESGGVVPQPTIVEALEGFNVTQLAGGNHHSVALTKEGDVLVWGRSDASALGIDVETLDKDNVVYQDGQHRLVKKPVKIPNLKASFIASGTDNSFAVTPEGKVYSWGFSENHQCGQGKDMNIVPVATLIDNTAIRGKKVTWAAGGGQFSVLAGPMEDN